MNHILRSYSLYYIIALFSLVGCEYYTERFKNIGKPPEIRKLEMPTDRQDYSPVKWPTEPHEQVIVEKSNPNSLWTPGSRFFFRDQRARKIGDILKVNININDTANLANKTEQVRSNKEKDGVNSLFGLEKTVQKAISANINPANLVDLSTSNNMSGSGTVARTEAVQTQIAAIVTQILPNGNLVIRGHQEVRVNYELREIIVEGIIRPEDLTTDNIISSDLIAEARISYGGKGNISNLQQPRLGSQVLDIISPF
ncbi:Basal body L-ring protein [Rickettsiales bacterium Ac37b]|nr:Basal body L-ring protein [Rickettsiales bacterium Ac37b]